MASILDITQSVSEITGKLSALDLKLDEVKAKIDALSVGSPVTQAQLDELAASLNSAKLLAAKVLDEGTELASPVPSEAPQS